jgi:hypothetical protein
MSVPVSGATAATLVTVVDGAATMLAASSTTLFWVNVSSNITLVQGSLDGGRATTLATPVAYSVADIAVASNGTLYWTTNTQVQAVKP